MNVRVQVFTGTIFVMLAAGRSNGSMPDGWCANEKPSIVTCTTEGACDNPVFRDSYGIPGTGHLMTIRLRFIAFRDDDGKEDGQVPSIDLQRISDQVTRLNAVYSTYGIQFTYNADNDVSFVNDTTFSHFCENVDPGDSGACVDLSECRTLLVGGNLCPTEECAMKHAYAGTQTASKLNIFVVKVYHGFWTGQASTLGATRPRV